MTERQDATGLAEVRELSSGLSLGAGLLAAAVLAMRPLLFGFEDPSASNALVSFVVILLAGVLVARGQLDGVLRLPPRGVALPFMFLMFLGFLMWALAPHRNPAELRLLAWITHALVFFSVYELTACGTRSDGGRPADADGSGVVQPGPGGPGRPDAARRTVVAAALATGSLVALHAFWQRGIGLEWMRQEVFGTEYGREMLARPGAAGRVGSDEVYATFIYPNALAGYLVLLLPVAAGAALASRAAHRMAAGLAAWALTAALAAALALTGSRGGAVAAGAAAFVFASALWGRRALELVRGRLPRSPAGRRAAFAAAGLLAGGAATMAVWFFLASPSMGVRLEYWRAGSAILLDHPTGTGLGSFADYYPQYKTAAGWDTHEAHNVYLSLAVEAGPAALVAFGLLAAAFFRRSLRPGAGEEEASPRGAHPARGQSAPGSRALPLAGGLAGILVAYVLSAASGTGMTSVVSVAELLAGRADGETALTALMHLALPLVWAGAFWVFLQVDPRSPALRAGLVAGIAGALVQGLVEFTFLVKATMLTAAALGAVALSWSGPERVRVRGGTGVLLALAAAAALGIVFWRGPLRGIRLWANAFAARSNERYAAELLSLRREAGGVSREAEIAREAARALARRGFELGLAPQASTVLDALGAGEERMVASSLGSLADEAASERLKALRSAWKARVEYLEEAPGDSAEVGRLSELGHRLSPLAPELRCEELMARAFRDLTVLAPASYLGWMLRAHLLFDQGHMAEAAANYEEAAARYPVNPLAWKYLGDARTHNRPRRAVEAYARMCETNRVVEDENTTLFGAFWEEPAPGAWMARLAAELEFAERELSSGDAPPAAPRPAFESPRRRRGRGAHPELHVRRGLILVAFRGYVQGAEEFGKALARRPDEVQFAVFRALALDMDAAHLAALAETVTTAENEEVSERAEARAARAWEEADRLQREGAPERRMAPFMLYLVKLRRPLARAVARGRPPPAPP